jgi:hypothetical protein
MWGAASNQSKFVVAAAQREASRIFLHLMH